MDINLSSLIGFHLRYLIRFSFSGRHPEFISGSIVLKMLK